MTERDRHVDEYVRNLDRLDGDKFASSWSDSDAKLALFTEIIHMTTETARPSRGRRMSRRATLLVTTIGIMSFATVGGWAAYQSSVETSRNVSCNIDGSAHILRAVTGDPIADCERVWREQTGSEPPELLAYDNSHGGVEVVPHGSDVPDAWSALESPFRQDQILIELEAALNDQIDGLSARCHPLDSARAIVQRELDRLGLDSWQIVAERGEADGEARCTRHLLEPGNNEVVLIPLEGSRTPDDASYAVLAHELGRRLDGKCLTIKEGAEHARRIAADVGIPDEASHLRIHELEDDNATCARAEVVVGGGIEITFRGPRR